MQLLRDNLTLWTSDMATGEDGAEDAAAPKTNEVQDIEGGEKA